MIQQCCNFPTPILWYTILYAQECYIIYSGAQPCNYCWQTTNYIPPSNLTIFTIKKKNYFRVEYSKYSHACTHGFILTRLPRGIRDSPLACCTRRSVPAAALRTLCAMVQRHGTWEGSLWALLWAGASSHPRAETAHSPGFCLALIKIQALQMNIQTPGV